MVVEFKAVTAIDSLVELLKVAEDSAVHHYEQDEAFHPGIFPGLILLARFASQRAGEEFKQAIMAAEKNRLNTNLQGERDELRWQLAQVTAERDAARQQHLVECRKYNAEVERRLALEKQVAELSGNSGELPAESYKWQVGDEVVRGNTFCKIKRVHGGYVWAPSWERFFAQWHLEEDGWKLHSKASDKPAEPAPEPAPEPYQWRVGDEIECNGVTRRRVIDRSEGWVFLDGVESGLPQREWEHRGWKLFRKGSGCIGLQQLTPRQVEISDSTGTDGEGQSK